MNWLKKAIKNFIYGPDYNWDGPVAIDLKSSDKKKKGPKKKKHGSTKSRNKNRNCRTSKA